MNLLRDRWANWDPECLSDQFKKEAITARFLTSLHNFTPLSRLSLKHALVSPVDSSTVTLRTQNLRADSSHCTASIPSSAGPLKPGEGGQVLGPSSHPLWSRRHLGGPVSSAPGSFPPSTPGPVWPMEGLSCPHKAWIFAGPRCRRPAVGCSWSVTQAH